MDFNKSKIKNNHQAACLISYTA